MTVMDAFVVLVAAAMVLTGLLLVAAVLIVNLWRTNMGLALDRLTASVAALTTVAGSVHAVVAHLVEEIRDLANNPPATPEATADELNGLADRLDAAKAEIAEAVTAGTSIASGEPEPEPAPAPAEGGETTEPAPAEGGDAPATGDDPDAFTE